MNINSVKTKEMIVYFGRHFDISNIPFLNCTNQLIERVDTFKLLGVYFNSELTWKHHVDYMLKK